VHLKGICLTKKGGGAGRVGYLLVKLSQSGHLVWTDCVHNMGQMYSASLKEKCSWDESPTAWQASYIQCAIMETITNCDIKIINCNTNQDASCKVALSWSWNPAIRSCFRVHVVLRQIQVVVHWQLCYMIKLQNYTTSGHCIATTVMHDVIITA